MRRAAILIYAGCALAGCGPAPEAVRQGRSELPADGAACLMLGPLAFSDVERGCGDRGSASLTNVCAEPVTLTAVRVVGAGFALTQSPAIPSGGWALGPGAAATVGVAFVPTVEGDASGELQVDVAGVTRSWPLQGRALAVPQVTQALDFGWQPERADVLFVIDNGPGLQPHLASIRGNLKAFARYARMRFGFDEVRIALAGVADAQGAPQMFDVASADFEARFGAAVDALDVGDSGHDALASATRSLEAMASDGLIRAHTSTSVVFVSDGPDRSEGPVYEWLNRMRYAVDAARRPWSFSVNAVVPSGAWSQCSADMDDGRFAAAVRETHGAQESLCTPDWEKTFEQLGKTFFGFRPFAYLTDVPDASRGVPLTVLLDGVEVPEVDSRGATVWRLDASLPAVVFEPMYAPAPQQVVQATYARGCP